MQQSSEVIVQTQKRREEKRWQLIQQILARSVATTWEEAKLEWEPAGSYRESDGTCLCTQTPITQHCVIINTKNGRSAVVGNVCINLFLEKTNRSILNCLARVGYDPEKGRLNKATLDWVMRTLPGCIASTEYGLYLFWNRKRKVPDEIKQLRLSVNLRVTEAAAKNAHTKAGE